MMDSSELLHTSEIHFPISNLKRLHESQQLPQTWGWKHNTEWHLGEDPLDFIRVKYPLGLAGTMKDEARPDWRSGAGFLVSQGVTSSDHYNLKYKVRFPKDFDFLKGGKLPGLYGGTAPMGGQSADGINGFTSRLMWRKKGEGEVYLYAPEKENTDPNILHNDKRGMSLGRGSWQFAADGQWHTIEQKISLNSPGHNDGQLQVSYDGQPMFENKNAVLRHTDSLKIDGICFSSFFGGDDESWAPSKDSYADFADFVLS